MNEAVAEIPDEPSPEKTTCDRCTGEAFYDYDDPPYWTCTGELICGPCMRKTDP